MSKGSGWDQRLQVAAGGKGLVGHAGAVLLRRRADRTGLTRALNGVLPRGTGPGWWDRGTVLVCLATAIVLGATSMSDIGLLAHQAVVFADPPSEATVRRALAGLDPVLLGRIGKARAKVRTRVWDLLERRPQGFPWLLVAGKLLSGWVVIDLDATLNHRPLTETGRGGHVQTRLRAPPARRVVREHQREPGHAAALR